MHTFLTRGLKSGANHAPRGELGQGWRVAEGLLDDVLLDSSHYFDVTLVTFLHAVWAGCASVRACTFAALACVSVAMDIKGRQNNMLQDR